ncbi:MAG: hypothetical protein HY074_00520 [Deltaproteobacteria bacterium]|nr:hypothetical protein [Deltaproteobacteria bacterium]
MAKISQSNHYANDFGMIFRSSAIFYYRYSKDFKTTLSFMNYWKLKRDIEVTVVASLRDLDGRLLSREFIAFDKAMVANYQPTLPGCAEFTGSVDIEAFSAKNLVIPYAAIMAIYETPMGISQVHSYTRNYSRFEVEEGRTITDGDEACWTLRDSATVQSFGVFHNGPAEQAAQTLKLGVSSKSGQRLEASIELPALKPFATVRILPRDHVPGLAEFLDGDTGSATLTFKVNQGFTRMLVGWERLDGKDFQATHSNFNYSRHETDRLEATAAEAYMKIPSLTGMKKEVRIYPESDPGSYWIVGEAKRFEYVTGRELTISGADAGALLRVSKSGGALPTRLVTALVLQKSDGVLPAECSLGVVHAKRPLKRLYWGPCSERSRLVLATYEAVYGDCPPHEKIELQLFSAQGQEPLKRTLTGANLKALSDGMSLTDVFPGIREFLGGEFGYYTLYCNYGGFFCFSLLENECGSVSLEHSF